MPTFLSGQMAYTDLADEYDPQVSGLFSWKNDDSTFGVCRRASTRSATSAATASRCSATTRAPWAASTGAGARR